jgi:predicted nucleic acid-binding protein
LADTSVIIDLDVLPVDVLPDEIAVSALTLAELAAGPHAAQEPHERAQRQARLQRTEAEFNVVPFDTTCARAFGAIYATVRREGSSARGRRSVDLLIAATALAENLPVYTRNPDDFSELTELIEVVGV